MYDKFIALNLGSYDFLSTDSDEQSIVHTMILLAPKSRSVRYSNLGSDPNEHLNRSLNLLCSMPTWNSFETMILLIVDFT